MLVRVYVLFLLKEGFFGDISCCLQAFVTVCRDIGFDLGKSTVII